jgi:hypothetical protein
MKNHSSGLLHEIKTTNNFYLFPFAAIAEKVNACGKSYFP